jgi:hypothetical protein
MTTQTELQKKLANMDPKDLARFANEFHAVILLTANQTFAAYPKVNKKTRRGIRSAIKAASKVEFGSPKHSEAISNIGAMMLNATGNGDTIH